MKRLRGVLLLVMVVSLFCSACGRRTADLKSIAALVRHRLASSGTESLVPVNTSTTFYEGDGVGVDTTGKANLTILGCTLEIYWGTDLTFKLAATNPATCVFTLEYGTIVVHVTPGTEAQIGTPWATITSFGTSFLVHVDLEKQLLWTIVQEGTILIQPFQAGLRPVRVGPDQQSWMLHGLAPVEPVPATRDQVPDKTLFPPLEALTRYVVGGQGQFDLTDATWLPSLRPAGPTITLWHAWSEAEVLGLKKVISVFQEQYPEIQFDIQYLPPDDLRAQFETATAAGGGPTLIFGPGEWGPALHDAGLVADLSAMASRNLLGRLHPMAVRGARYGGAWVGMPHALKGVVMYRNAKIIPEASQTFDELLSRAKEATRDGLFGTYLECGFFYSAAHLDGMGGQLMDASGYPTFNSDWGVEWLRLLRTFSYTGPVSYYTDEDLKLFEEGRVGIIIDGTWNLPVLRDSVGAENLVIDPWPAYRDGHLSGYVQTDNLYLNARAEGSARQAAEAFIEFLLSPQAQPILATVGHIPAVTDVWIDDPLLLQAMKAFVAGTPFPVIPETNAYYGPMDTAIRSVLDQQAYPEVVLHDAYGEIAAAIEKMHAQP